MLQEKLFGRGEEEEVVHRVMSDLESLIVEDKIIESRIHAYISSGKTERYIRTKLRQKKFDTELIEKLLTEREGILHDPETYRPQIERAVQKWVQKWISKKALQYELSIKYPDARDVITELLVDYDDKTILQEKAPELLRKYSQEQFVWKLSQKGFQISDIYAALRRR
jgi:SOS response regulatory protein OraA/RecX